MKTNNSPIFKTLTVKIYSNTRLFEKKLLLLTILKKVFDLPFFNDISKFDLCSYFPLTGRERHLTLKRNSLKAVEELIKSSTARSIDLHKKQEVHHVRFHEIVYIFGKRLREHNDGYNQLALYIPLEEITSENLSALTRFFEMVVSDFQACYGFSCLHIDSPDSYVVKEEFGRLIRTQPVDCVSSNRYIWSSETEIKDVCWLNYISKGHLSRLHDNVSEEIKSLCPYSKDVSNGLVFAASDLPNFKENDIKIIKLLRNMLEKLICDDNWYELA